MVPGILVCVAMLVVSTLVAQSDAPRIKSDQGNKHVGRRVTMCGKVVSLECNDSNDHLLLQLDRQTWTSGGSIAMPASKRDAFGYHFEEPYLGSRVCGTGVVKKIDNRHAAVVETPQDLAIETPSAQMTIPPFGQGAAPRCAAGMKPAKVIREVKPNYTRDAMRAKVRGKSLVEAVVEADGTVGDVRIVHSLDAEHGLDRQALAAVKQWRFEPAILNGKAVSSIVLIMMSFDLR